MPRDRVPTGARLVSRHVETGYLEKFGAYELSPVPVYGVVVPVHERFLPGNRRAERRAPVCEVDMADQESARRAAQYGRLDPTDHSVDRRHSRLQARSAKPGASTSCEVAHAHNVRACCVAAGRGGIRHAPYSSTSNAVGVYPRLAARYPFRSGRAWSAAHQHNQRSLRSIPAIRGLV